MQHTPTTHSVITPEGSTCGHAHRSILAALRCRGHLLHDGCERGTWRAKWHNSKITNATQDQIDSVEFEAWRAQQ